MRAAALFLVAMAALACGHARAPSDDDDEGDRRMPVDHFTTSAVFRAPYWQKRAPEGEATWPAPRSVVGLVELTCTSTVEKKGRVVRCVPGLAIPKAFLDLRVAEELTSGAALKQRLAACYTVAARAWTPAEIAAYERALATEPKAIAGRGDEFVLVHLAEDRRPTATTCNRDPDGTCLYRMDTSAAEGTLSVRASRGGARASLPFAPSPIEVEFIFSDGHVPDVLHGVRTTSQSQEPQDPSGIDWASVVSWYEKHEASSPNLSAAMVLAGAADRASALDRDRFRTLDDLTPSDPCGATR
jgi:hypothetical protein